jgi:hypothetical protein
MTSQIKDHGIRAAAAESATQSVDVPAHCRVKVDGRDGEMETASLHGL